MRYACGVTSPISLDDARLERAETDPDPAACAPTDPDVDPDGARLEAAIAGLIAECLRIKGGPWTSASD